MGLWVLLVCLVAVGRSCRADTIDVDGSNRAARFDGHGGVSGGGGTR